MGVRTQVWGPDPCKGLTPASHSSCGPPRRRRVLWAAGAKACRRAAVVLSVRHTEEKRPAPSDWRGWVPADQVLRSPRALPWRTPFALLVESRLLPTALHAQDSWPGGRGRATPLSATRDGRPSVLHEGPSREGPQATLPALEASCLPSSCGGRGYRRARTRRTQSRWRGQPSAGWGPGL